MSRSRIEPVTAPASQPGFLLHFLSRRPLKVFVTVGMSAGLNPESQLPVLHQKNLIPFGIQNQCGGSEMTGTAAAKKSIRQISQGLVSGTEIPLVGVSVKIGVQQVFS